MISMIRPLLKGLGQARRYSTGQTIYALSTHPGKAAIAIVRVSGPSCAHVYRQLTGRSRIMPRVATVATLYSQHKSVLDHALTLYFKGPKSYTGEDLLEVHLHGGQAVTRAVMKAIADLNTKDTPIRYAGSGEFTKRAFANGQLDLTQIEGIRDIIEAETEFQRQAAIESAGGKTKELYDSWRDAIAHNMGMLTALIDFSDDNADVTGNLFGRTKLAVASLLAEINGHLDQIQRTELLVSGIKMNLLGPPNAGKSSLLNSFANRDAAIVSDIAGTTRDVLEVGMDMFGYKIIIGDTAGLRKLESVSEGHAKIEYEGIRRAKQRFKSGDLVVAVLPVVDPSRHTELVAEGIAEELELLGDKKIIIALNKIDQLGDSADLEAIVREYSIRLGIPGEDIVPVSCTTQKGINELVARLSVVFKDLTHSSHGPPLGASQRIQDLLKHDVIASLEQFLAEEDVVIATAELQQAVDGIGKITGRGIGTEEILGVVFSSFCIGK
ncbi:tRNA modification GTPase Mss1p, mitochondrial [Trichomonascus vanleenenianus]|uniref:Mss1p n=1 Tax=Trichomonascus vanleenenianus TaxID=2268995 RepID=UPI003ECAF218